MDTDYLRFLAYCKPGTLLSQTLDGLVRQFQREGYALVDGYAWPFARPENLILDPTRVEREILVASHGKRSLIFWKHPFEFSCRLLCSPEYGTRWMISVEIDTLMGPDNELGKQNTETFLAVIRTSLEHYSPFYGHAPVCQDAPAIEQITHWQPVEVYPVNFYGAECVERLGRERLLSAPAERIEELENGGVLVAPSIRAIYASDPDSLVAVKQHFG